MKLRLKFSKEEPLKFISHLDLQRLFTRAFRRAGIKLGLKGGFNPQPKISFALALPLGCTSSGEYLEAEIVDELKPQEVKDRLFFQLPEGISIKEVTEASQEDPSLTSRVSSCLYRVRFQTEESLNVNKLKETVKKLLQRKELEITRQKKKKTKKIDIIPLIEHLEVMSVNSFQGEIEMHLKTGVGGSIKPQEIMSIIEKEAPLTITNKKIHRKKLFLEGGK